MVPKQIGVTMTKLWPLLNHGMLFYEMCFALSFYNALYWLQIIVCAIMLGFKTQSHS